MDLFLPGYFVGVAVTWVVLKIQNKPNKKIVVVERIGSEHWRSIRPFKWRYIPNDPRYFKWDIID